MNNFFSKKSELAESARIHTSRMTKYNNETNDTIYSSKIYGPDSLIIPRISDGTDVKSIITNSTSFDAAASLYLNTKFDKSDKICILNFASYKNPGGKFMEGSSAQEESLCHVSNLYNVLCAFDNTYYEWNRANLNKALYLNRAIYSPNVIFDDNPSGVSKSYKYKFDVLTCAAPNLGPGLKYKNVTPEENHEVLKSRIKFILDIMAENYVDFPILGAFGCGVFKQNPTEVASIFKELINNYEFKGVIFAIPGGANLQAFIDVFKN